MNLDITRKILIEKHLTVKLRISNLKLNIETGRYGKILRCDRICPDCDCRNWTEWEYISRSNRASNLKIRPVRI